MSRRNELVAEKRDVLLTGLCGAAVAAADDDDTGTLWKFRALYFCSTRAFFLLSTLIRSFSFKFKYSTFVSSAFVRQIKCHVLV